VAVRSALAFQKTPTALDRIRKLAVPAIATAHQEHQDYATHHETGVQNQEQKIDR